MARRPSQTFTEKELEIMQVIWDLGEASARDIQERLPGNRHYNSVMTIIRVLEKKGHLTHREEGRAYVYSARVSQQQSHRKMLGHLVKQVFGGSAASLVLKLVEAGELTRDDLDKIRRELPQQTRKGSKP